jgi:hypothetical protein
MADFQALPRGEKYRRKSSRKQQDALRLNYS